MSNNNLQLNLPEGFTDNYVYEAKKFLRSEMPQEDVIEIIADFMIDEINETMDEEDLPTEEVVENEVNTIAALVVTKALEECLKEQSTWVGMTDCDKLTNAFEELSENGIVAKENFTCCQTCGSYEISEYAVKGDYGYVFYHQQDTERAVEGDGVYLSYGNLGLAKKPFEEITDQIVKTIEKHGLKVDWNGTSNTRMLVNLDWKKRLTVY